MSVQARRLDETAARRREIGRRLAAEGLIRVRRRLRAIDAAVPAAETDGRGFIRRLQNALGGLGPVYSALAAYLARRPDLLRTEECLTLAAMPTPAALPAAAVRERLRVALAADVGEVFASFEDRPWTANALHQVHRARVREGGEEVLLRVSRFLDGDERTARDLELLPELAPAFAGHPTCDPELALMDFRRWFENEIDLEVHAERLETLAGRVADADLMRVARVCRRLSTSQVLTVERLDGVELQAIAADGWAARARRYDLARRLHLLLLVQALVAGLFPVTADMVRLPDGRLGLVGGELAEIPDASRVHLWLYLRATAADRPDLACEHLIHELEPHRRGADEPGLLLRLRQMVPFRDGAWSEHGDTIAEYLVLHWQVVHGSGFAPRPHLRAFYEALFWAARLGQRLAPRADPLRDAQEDMRWLAGWMQFRQVADPRRLAPVFEANLASLLQLPGKIDRLLELVTTGEARLRVEVREPPSVRRRKNASTLTICWGLAAAILMLAANEFGIGEPETPWSDSVGALLFAGVGVLLLRALWRQGR